MVMPGADLGELTGELFGSLEAPKTASSVNVIIKFLAIGAKKIKESMKGVEQGLYDMAYKTAQLDKKTGELRWVYRKFKMELLGVMFFGMQLARTFGGLHKAMHKITVEGAFNAAQFAIMASTFSSPVWQAYQKTMWGISNAILRLPGPLRALIGTGQLLLGWFGQILFAGAMLIGGLASLKFAFPPVFAAITGLGLGVVKLIPPIAILTAALIGMDMVVRALGLPTLWEGVMSAIDSFDKAAARQNKKVSEGKKALQEWLGGVYEGTVTWVSEKWEDITTAFDDLGKWLEEAWEATVKWFRDNLTWDNITDAFDKLGKWCDETWEATVKWFRDTFTWNNIKSAFTNLAIWVNRTWEATVTWYREFFSWNRIKTAFEKLEDWARRTWEITVDFILNAPQALWNWIIEHLFPQPGHRQMGGAILRTGPYMLHKGEYVVPRGRAQNITNFGGLSPTINIYITGDKSMDEEALARRISERMYLEMRRLVM